MPAASVPARATNTVKIPSKRDPRVRAVVTAWRELTGGGAVRDSARRTLVAVSGGADSSALLLALRGATDSARSRLVVAHIVHDLRPEHEALADRDSAGELARALGLPFVEARVTASVRADARAGDDTNLEARARRLRYSALARLAREQRCPFVAVAHHADDLLETMLMRLLRGAGPRGLGAMRPARTLARPSSIAPGSRLAPRAGVTLIRPMLALTRADAQGLCRECGWAWREDATNADTTRLRSAIRADVLPALARLAPPGLPARLARSAGLLHAAADTLALAGAALRERAFVRVSRADELRLVPASTHLRRDVLRDAPPAVVGEALRAACLSLDGSRRGADRLSASALAPVVRAVRDRTGGEARATPSNAAPGGARTFDVARWRFVLTTSLLRVELRAMSSPPRSPNPPRTPSNHRSPS